MINKNKLVIRSMDDVFKDPDVDIEDSRELIEGVMKSPLYSLMTEQCNGYEMRLIHNN